MSLTPFFFLQLFLLVLFISLSFPLRIGLLCFQARSCKRRLNLGYNLSQFILHWSIFAFNAASLFAFIQFDVWLNCLYAHSCGFTIPTAETPSMLVNGVRFDELPIIHIHASKNNTIITVTDHTG